MLLSVEHISKSFGDTVILKDVSFTLEKGKSLCLVAPSGAGKSTLLSIVGLLMGPDEGRVVLNDVDATALPDGRRSQMRAGQIGFLFQHTQLIGSLRAYENVALAADFAAAKTASGAELDEKAQRMLCALGLEERLQHFPFQLSLGQKRRVATARALFMDPGLIIADEPTNDLDAQNVSRVVEALFEPVEAGRAGLLFATHDAALAQRADEILYL